MNSHYFILNKKKLSISLLLAIIFSAIAYLCMIKLCKKYCSKPPSDGIPKVQAIPDSKLLKDSKKVSDLFLIAVALEKYKSDHGAYPISDNNGKGWDSYLKSDGSTNQLWIKELYPHYIKYIPIDSRMSTHPAEQYAYISNGANYKLIVGYPEDCNLVKSELAELIIPFGGCVAYGFWTSKAALYW